MLYVIRRPDLRFGSVPTAKKTGENRAIQTARGKRPKSIPFVPRDDVVWQSHVAALGAPKIGGTRVRETRAR
jgi:hypothetical protein